MSKFVEETMFRWVNGTSANGILVFEPCDDGVQFFVCRELRKGRMRVSAGFARIATEMPYHSFQLNLFNFELLHHLRHLQGGGDYGGSWWLIETQEGGFWFLAGTQPDHPPD